jgi:hypothetical protein
MAILDSDGNERKILRVAKDEVKDAIKKKEDIMFQETKILQKVNKVHREAFKERFPGQCEHILRLTAERLQAVLTRKPTDLSDPETWVCTAEEIQLLSDAMYNMYIINNHIKEEQNGLQDGLQGLSTPPERQ